MADARPLNGPDRPGKRDEEILAAALDLFFERGFQAVGLRDLTEVLNLNVATLYHYFKSKDQILFRLQSDGMKLLLGGAADVIGETEGQSPTMRLQALLRMHLQYHTDHHKIAKLHFSDFRSLSSDSQSIIRSMMKEYERHFLDVVKAGISSGEFCGTDAKLTAYGLLGAGAYVSYWYQPGGAASAAAVVEANMELLLQGVLTR